MTSNFIHLTPVMPSADIARDVKWYNDYLGFEQRFSQNGYSVLYRDGQWIHLQWHADTDEDPLLGGSVIKIFVIDIQRIFDEMVERRSIKPDRLRKNTSWGTHEFGLYDLNKNAIFFVQDID